jgi:ribosomal protein S18 acetylase RimI-like enzyme
MNEPTTAAATAIRAARPADEAALRSLALRLSAFPLPPWRRAEDIATADARDMIAAVRDDSPDNEVWIAERSGVVVGCLHVLLTTDFFGTRHAHISVIATTEAAEGSGAGRALLAHAEQWARERGQSLLTLNVFAANERARCFYERAGLAPEMLKYAKPLA